MNELNVVVDTAKASFLLAATPAELENAKALFLGKTGRVTELMKGLVALPVEEKKSRGAAINQAKQAIEAAKAEAQAAQTEVIAKAKAAIEADRVKMMNEVRGEVSRLVVETAAKVLEQNLDDAQRGRLNEAAVKQLAR